MKYRKKQVIVVVAELGNGDKVVANENNLNDQWVISKDVFEDSYEAVVESEPEAEADEE